MYWKPNDSSQHKEKLHVILERGWRYQGNRERSAVIPKYISLSITIHLTSISKRERRKSYFLRSPCQSCRPRPTTRVDAAGSPWNRVPPCTDSNPGLIYYHVNNLADYKQATHTETSDAVSRQIYVYVFWRPFAVLRKSKGLSYSCDHEPLEPHRQQQQYVTLTSSCCQSPSGHTIRTYWQRSKT